MAGWGGRQHTVERSMNEDFMEGAVDGQVKKSAPDRGGVVEGYTASCRTALDPEYYGTFDSPPSMWHNPGGFFAKMR